MSHIILCKGKMPDKIHENLSILPYPFSKAYLNDICEKLWGNCLKQDVWMVRLEGRNMDIDDVFSEAQFNIHINDYRFEDTELYHLLKAILRSKVEIVIFYGDITTPLINVYSDDEFMEHFLKGLMSRDGSVYIRYKMNN